MHANRKIKVRKSDLIEKIKSNKEAHVLDFEKAKDAYKNEALKQIESILTKLQDGDTNVKLSLVSPVNKSEDYDKAIRMFEWDLDEEVELTQQEYLEYVEDETPFAMQAKLLNSTYLS